MTKQNRVEAYAAPTQGSNALKDIISGTFGGIAQVAAGHPLDTVRVRLQTMTPNADGKMPYKGLIDCTTKTFKMEGMSGLYKGAFAPLAGSMAHNAGVFFSYGQAKKLVGADAPGAPLFRFWQAGALAAISISIVETPVDMLKIKLQSQVGEGEYKGVIDAAQKVWKARGIQGLYQGLPATLLRNIPCFGLYFMGAEFGYRLACPVGQTHSKQQVFLGGLIGGGCAGFAFWGLLYPLETVKTRMQSDKMMPSERLYKSVADCFQKTWAQGGLKTFYRGYSASLARAIVVNSAIFAAVFSVKDALSDAM